MAILVTGATGKIGSVVLNHLAHEDVEVLGLTRDRTKASFPDGVEAVKGDLLDVDSMRAVLGRASTLFLLAAVTADEFTQTLLAINLAHEAGIDRLVYLSVFQGEAFANVPHFSAKHTAELAIEQFDLPATILRSNCLMQNDFWFKDALLGSGIYPFPIGNQGVSMVDIRDVGEIAAAALLEREQSAEPLPHQIIYLAGPASLTGTDVAGIWSRILGKPVRYAGDDLDGFERQMRQFGPAYAALDLRLMLERFQRDGMRASDDDVDEMAALLGRALRSYASFAKETLGQWQA